MNLSKQNFTKTEYKLLGYNLNFIPTPKSVNKAELAQDIKQFNRRIKLRDHFGISQYTKPIFKSASSWEPTDTHHTVRTFMEDFSRKVESNLDNDPTPPFGGQKNKHNLSKSELGALEDLKSRDDIIITNADKGGAVVITDVDDYIDEANRQLPDQCCYKKVDVTPTSLYSALVDSAIGDLKTHGHLEEKMANQLKTSNPKTQKEIEEHSRSTKRLHTHHHGRPVPVHECTK